jgi:hypothetical protein
MLGRYSVTRDFPLNAVGTVGRGLVEAAVAGLLLLALLGAGLSLADLRLGNWTAPLAALLGTVGALMLRQLPSGRTMRWDWTGPLLLTAALVAALYWVLSFSSAQPSDFGVYWRCGAQARLPLTAWIEAHCQSEYLAPSAVYWRRSLFYTVPLLAPAGPNYLLLKLGNAVLLLAGFAALWAGVRAFGGARFALLALLGALLGPEAWFALTLATPDHVAVPAVVIALLALARLVRGTVGRPPWGAAFVLGLAVTVADQARSIGPILLLATGLAIVLGYGALRARLEAGAAAVGLYLALSAGLGLLSAGVPSYPATLAQMLATLDLSAPTDWLGTYRFVQYAWPVVPEELRDEVALSHILAEATGGARQLLPWLWARLQILFSGAGYPVFAALALPENPDTADIAAVSVPAAPWLAGMLALLPRPVIGAALAGMLLPAPNPLAVAARCWLAAFLLLVVGLGEVQPRYVVLAWPAVAILAASAMMRQPAAAGTLRHGAAAPLAGAAAILALLLLVTAGAPLLRPHLAFPLPAGAVLASARPDCPGSPVLLLRNRSITIRLPEGTDCALLRLTLPPGWQEIGTVVTRAEPVFRFQRPPAFPLDYAFGGEASATLGERMAAWHQAAPPPGEQEILLRVTRRAPGEATLVLLLPVRLR